MLYSLLFSTAFANPWPDLSGKVSTALKRGRSKDHALVIAVEDYAFVSPVPGAAKNGEDWFLWLSKGQKIRVKNIQYVLDNQASRENILDVA